MVRPVLPLAPLQVAPVGSGIDAHVSLPLMFTLVVGGAGSAILGVANVTGCESFTTPPVTTACPLELSASTLPELQLPTPTRGVDNVPLMMALPLSVRLPFVPTLPPELSRPPLLEVGALPFWV